MLALRLKSPYHAQNKIQNDQVVCVWRGGGWTEGCVLEERKRILKCLDRKDRLARKARIEAESRRMWTCKKMGSCHSLYACS